MERYTIDSLFGRTQKWDSVGMTKSAAINLLVCKLTTKRPGVPYGKAIEWAKRVVELERANEGWDTAY